MAFKTKQSTVRIPRNCKQIQPPKFYTAKHYNDVVLEYLLTLKISKEEKYLLHNTLFL